MVLGQQGDYLRRSIPGAGSIGLWGASNHKFKKNGVPLLTAFSMKDIASSATKRHKTQNVKRFVEEGGGAVWTTLTIGQPLISLVGWLIVSVQILASSTIEVPLIANLVYPPATHTWRSKIYSKHRSLESNSMCYLPSLLCIVETHAQSDPLDCYLDSILSLWYQAEPSHPNAIFLVTHKC